MAGRKIGTRDEWRVARDELGKLEAEHAELNEEIKRKRLERTPRPQPGEPRDWCKDEYPF